MRNVEFGMRNATRSRSHLLAPRSNTIPGQALRVRTEVGIGSRNDNRHGFHGLHRFIPFLIHVIRV
mgnify:CR=1 FL=1